MGQSFSHSSLCTFQHVSRFKKLNADKLSLLTSDDSRPFDTQEPEEIVRSVGRAEFVGRSIESHNELGLSSQFSLDVVQGVAKAVVSPGDDSDAVKKATPLENLEPVLREDIQKLEEVHSTPLENLEPVLREDIQKVASLRQRFHHSIAPGWLVGDRRVVVPTSGFSYSAQQIWKIIKDNKDLDLPAHKVMMATVHCEEIANERLSNFRGNQACYELEEAAQNDLVKGFGKKLNLILGSWLSEPEMVVGWYHSHPGFGCWLSGVDINTQQSFEASNQRVVAIVVDPIQSVQRKGGY